MRISAAKIDGVVQRLKEKIIFVLLAVALATSAAAHVPPIAISPAVDLLHEESTAQDRVQSFSIVAGATAFDEVAHLELPPPSIADELAHRFAADDVDSPSHLAIFDRTVSRKLASGPLAVFEENNVNEPRELSLELHRTIGNVRARWYDPATGSFLSADPLGYRDSSNLYAFGAGDPVNKRDPLGEGILDDIRFAVGQKYTDVATQVVATGKAIKGIAKSVGKTVVGTVAAANLIHEASKLGNVQAQLQFVGGIVATHDAVAQWGTSAGHAIAEPDLIRQAFYELTPEEFAEETFDAAIMTAAFVAPAAKAKVPPGRGAPTVNPRHVAQAASLEELDALITRLGERAVRHGDRARAAGMSGVDAGNYAEATFGRYAEAMNNRLAVQGSQYTVEWQPAMLPGYGRVPPFVQYPNGQIYPFSGSLRLDAGLSDTTRLVSTPAVSADVYPSIMRGYDVTVDAAKISAVTKYQKQFGVPIRDIRPR